MLDPELATTESRIAKTLALQAAKLTSNGDGVSILFGHELGGEGTVKATWKVSYHSRNLEGKNEMAALLRRGRRQTVSAASRENWTGPYSQKRAMLQVDEKEEVALATPPLPHTNSSDSNLTLVDDSDSEEVTVRKQTIL